jgi:predicted enzyme related to lactoylglutathione lyase
MRSVLLPRHTSSTGIVTLTDAATLADVTRGASMTTPSSQTSPTAPNLIVFGVGDVEAAKTLYSAVLGTEPYVDSPYYVGYRTGDVEIGLDPNAARQGTTSPITYWATHDIHARVEALVAAGATVQRPARDVGGGMLVAVLADADGNLLGLRQA